MVFPKCRGLGLTAWLIVGLHNRPLHAQEGRNMAIEQCGVRVCTQPDTHHCCILSPSTAMFRWCRVLTRCCLDYADAAVLDRRRGHLAFRSSRSNKSSGFFFWPGRDELHMTLLTGAKPRVGSSRVPTYCAGSKPHCTQMSARPPCSAPHPAKSAWREHRLAGPFSCHQSLLPEHAPAPASTVSELRIGQP